MTARTGSPLLVRLIAYYGVLAGAAVLIAPRIPLHVAPTSDVQIALAAAMAMVGALLLVIPVAWIYMRTKTWRYDASLVQTVIILPVAVAGIVLIIRDSLALAFSLAGIVAAVRFRNTLKDTKDAVYIFIAIALGLAAGVQAFSAAYVMSLMFVLLVLVLWRFDVGTDPARVAGVLVAEGASPPPVARLPTCSTAAPSGGDSCTRRRRPATARPSRTSCASAPGPVPTPSSPTSRARPERGRSFDSSPRLLAGRGEPAVGGAGR